MSLTALLQRRTVTPVTPANSTEVTAPGRAIADGYPGYPGYTENSKGKDETGNAPLKTCTSNDSGYHYVDENRQRRTIEIDCSEVTQVTGNDPPPLSPADQAAIEESIVERASILEFDAGMARRQAEIAAQSAMRVYQALVTLPDGSSPRWLTLLAPGCDLAEARATLAHQFGPERVLDVRECGHE
jgi:hypothetical protein